MKNTVAIIEDDPFIKYLYDYLMKKAGLNAEIMEDADLLMEKLEEGNIGLIIMDINLRNTYLKDQKINGLELSRHVKKQQKYAEIPIIIVSAFSLESGKKKFLEESLAQDFIAKPITDYNMFLNKVQNLIVS